MCDDWSSISSCLQDLGSCDGVGGAAPLGADLRIICTAAPSIVHASLVIEETTALAASDDGLIWNSRQQWCAGGSGSSFISLPLLLDFSLFSGSEFGETRLRASFLVLLGEREPLGWQIGCGAPSLSMSDSRIRCGGPRSTPDPETQENRSDSPL